MILDDIDKTKSLPVSTSKSIRVPKSIDLPHNGWSVPIVFGHQEYLRDMNEQSGTLATISEHLYVSLLNKRPGLTENRVEGIQ